MNTTTPWKHIAIGLLLAPVLLYGEYRIEWSAFGGGSGVSTGGVYSATGTIGQDEAGTASGGNYGLVSGYWGVIGGEQRAGAPRLGIQRVGNSLRVFWALSATNFVLEQTTTLRASPSIPWTQGAFAYQTNASQISVMLPLPTGNRFFRLRKS